MSDFDYEADINLGKWERSPGYFERPSNDVKYHNNIKRVTVAKLRRNGSSPCQIKKEKVK